GPLVNGKNVGSEQDAMVSSVDLYKLFAEIAGVKLDKVVPKTHTVDAQSMMPYLKKTKSKEIRKINFTQVGQNIHTTGTVLWPCVIASVNTCIQLFPTASLCEDENGEWYGPGGVAGDDGIETCCDVNAQTQSSYTIFPDAQWAIRDDQYKLVLTEQPNCTTNETDLQYGFYAINDDAPLPALDRADDDLLTSTSLPAQGLDSDQQKA